MTGQGLHRRPEAGNEKGPEGDWLQAIGRLTLPGVLVEQAKRMEPDRIAIREKAYGIWKAYSWQTYLDYVRQTALGFIDLGLRRGENIGIVTNNHAEWLFSQLGGQAAGAVTMNLFTSSVPEELALALNRIRASIVVVQDQEQVDKLLEKKAKLSHVRRVVYVDPTGMRNYRNDPWLIPYIELLDRGRRLDMEEPERFPRELRRGRPDDIALMIQTSGTTGMPKLAMLKHRCFTEMARQWLETAPIGAGSNWISITPPAWIVDQMWGAGVTLAGGMTMNFPETLETIEEDFREIGPSIIISSSRFWEDLASKIRVKMGDAGWLKRKLFELSERVGYAVTDLEAKKGPVPRHLRLLQGAASRLTFQPLLDRVGCARMVSAFTGGHPISPQVIRFFRAMGLNLKQCYGLTEAGGIFQVQPDGEFKPETVGKPLPRTEVKIADNQEVLVKSESVFAGYYNDYQATEGAFSNGWLLTGDAGYIDEDGHLLIIGRKEDIIRDKKGAAFSPDFIETRLKFSPYIKEAVIFGEGRPYLTALVNIDFGNVGNWAEDRMIAYTTYMDLTQRPEVEKLILKELQDVNGQLPDPMKIRKFILLYKLLDADDEELTRTGKVRRRFVYGLYIKLIEAMYDNSESLDVKGTVRYRDGQVGTLETRVRILTA